jgi:heat-inducible transcriptional repressor
LTAQPEFREIDKLNQVLEFLENSNVWKHISYVKEVTGKTSITFGKEIGLSQLSIASTTINTSDNSTRELSIVGPVRMNYSMVKGILNFIKEEMEKYGR